MQSYENCAPWAEKVPEEQSTEYIDRTESTYNPPSRAASEIPLFDPFYMLYLLLDTWLQNHRFRLDGYLLILAVFFSFSLVKCLSTSSVPC